MSIDVIIVSNASNDHLKSLTVQTINTAKFNEKEVFVNVIVVEGTDTEFYNSKTIKQKGEFCYNKFLNEGAALGTSEYIAFCNNDLIFGDNWASKIISEMEKNNVRSACPYCPNSNILNKTLISQDSGVYFGYEIRFQFVGWCIVWERTLWEKIKMDEDVKFWASDNASAKSLELAGEKHILVTNSIVSHVWNGSNTLNGIHPNKRYDLMHKQIKIFNKKYGENYFELGTE